MLLRKIISILFLGLTIFSFAQCKTAENKIEQDKPLHQSITSTKNDMTISKLNKSKSMELHVKKVIKQGDPATHFEYTVYNTTTKTIIKQGYYRGTNVDWNDNTSIKLVPYIGIEQKPTSENPDDLLLSDTQTQITIIKLKN
ncbi:hypothetical protein ATO12_07225 [Aquimarina atlantica]|uniref:Lipoprotein n=1 Tax=Aquimarina atlantica TaxID=1317122 RepID=A0A023BP68_9FLAO|nr:hypothetical protein [Aquimarina atlantica]EZH71483.1 hypothetical protein ATO12_07225 [Aquimarina atlantica]